MPATDPNNFLTVLSGTFTATSNGADQKSSAGGMRFFLNITAASGTTPSLTVSIQSKDPLSGVYVNLPGASFPAQTGVGSAELTVYPGIATAANAEVAQVLSGTFRAVATISGTTPSFTLTLSGVPLE